ncbi:MAG: hypothetical protein K8I27_01095 [Planctomycetes bacterium]|nr:hypothetical protein [Planctomycetota bacterium]
MNNLNLCIFALALALVAGSLNAQPDLLNETFEGVSNSPTEVDTATGLNLPASGWTSDPQFTPAQAGATATAAEWSINDGSAGTPGGATSAPSHFGSIFLRFDAYQGVSSISDYSKAAITPSLDASGFSTNLYLNFNLVNDGFTGAGGPNNAFEIWYIDNDAGVPAWTQIFTVQESGPGTRVVTSESIDLSVLLGSSDFQLAFVVEGASTLGIDEWIVDNISVADEIRTNNGDGGGGGGGGDDGGCSTDTGRGLHILTLLGAISLLALGTRLRRSGQ